MIDTDEIGDVLHVGSQIFRSCPARLMILPNETSRRPSPREHGSVRP
jgi:hypothetical protein